MQPLILILETATNVCSVALFKGKVLLASKESNTKNTHSKNILRFVQNVINDAGVNMQNLNAVAFSKGPGSYTGLRIGSTAAKALAYTLEIPLISYDTLQSAAHALCKFNNYLDNTIYIAAIDARREEIYIHICNNKLNILYSTSNMVLNENSFNSYINQEKIVLGGNCNEKIGKFISNNNVIDDEHNIFSSILSVDIVIEKYTNKEYDNIAYSTPNYVKNFYTLKKN